MAESADIQECGVISAKPHYVDMSVVDMETLAADVPRQLRRLAAAAAADVGLCVNGRRLQLTDVGLLTI